MKMFYICYMLSEIQCKTLIEKVVHFSPTDETECLIQSGQNALTRFANNIIHQNVSETENLLSIRVVVGNRMGRFTTNRLDDESLKNAVDKVLKIALVIQPEKELLPKLKPQPYPKISRHFEETANFNAFTRAKVVQSMISEIKQNNLSSAGIFETGESALALGNSNGHICYYIETGTALSITVTGEDSSGYVFKTAPGPSELNPLEAAQDALRNTVNSANPKEIEPGEYTVILKPQAVVNLVPFLLFDYITGVSSFSGLGVEEKRSFLTDKNGEIIHGVKNLRFNQSMIEMLNHVIEMAPPERMSDDESETIYVVPAMKVEGFRFTSGT